VIPLKETGKRGGAMADRDIMQEIEELKKQLQARRSPRK